MDYDFNFTEATWATNEDGVHKNEIRVIENGNIQIVPVSFQNRMFVELLKMHKNGDFTITNAPDVLPERPVRIQTGDM